MKRRLKVTPILLCINIMIILIIITFYVVRLIKYYYDENVYKIGSANVTLYNYILKNQSFTDLENGLVKDENDNIYRYKGNDVNNYLYFDGILYRIVLLNDENNVMLISDKSVSGIYYGNYSFDKSYASIWLNKDIDVDNSGIFENTIKDSSLLSYSKICNDEISDLENITCKNYNNDYKISLLSLYDYVNAGGSDSYLNNGEAFYLSTSNTSENYYVSTSGSVGTQENKILNVRPVITLDGGCSVISGDGSIDNPYTVVKNNVSKVSDVYVGEYVKLNDNVYRIIESNDNIIVSGLVDQDTKLSFGNNNNFSSSKVNKYIESNFISSIKDYIIENTYYNGKYLNNNYDYRNIYSSSFNSYYSLINISDMFINDTNNVFTVTGSYESNNTIYVINDKYYPYKDLTTNEYNIKIKLTLKSDLNISSGSGSIDNPYLIEDGDKNE